jgi:hypothetical protein
MNRDAEVTFQATANDESAREATGRDMRDHGNPSSWRQVVRRTVLAVGIGAVQTIVAARGAEPQARPRPSDDLTFRPTVIVRSTSGQGSGTIIASVKGETLVLTAAHVVKAKGSLTVELHRYNLGVERTLPANGWPLSLPAHLAAIDPIGDVAVLRIRGRPALPYVARIAAVGDEPVPSTVVASVGIDGGELLESWQTHLREVVWFSMRPDQEGRTRLYKLADARSGPRDPASEINVRERPFLITSRAPEHGRSGGGLYRDGARLVGVCVGRIELEGGQAWGVFASIDSVQRLLREHDLNLVIDRSAARRTRPSVTTTQAPKPDPPASTRPQPPR